MKKYKGIIIKMLFLKFLVTMFIIIQTIDINTGLNEGLCMNDDLIISISLNLPIVNTLSYFNRNPSIPYYFVVLAAVSLV